MSSPKLHADALTDVESLLDHTGVRSADNTNKLIRAINSVSFDCQMRVCKRLFKEQTFTDEKHDGDGSPVIQVDQYPIVSVASLKITESGTALDSGDYWIYAASGQIRLKTQSVQRLPQTVTITYDAGYDPLPDELVQSILIAAAFRSKKRDHNAEGVDRQSHGDQSTSYITTAYPAIVTDIWNYYRRKRATAPTPDLSRVLSSGWDLL